MAATDDAASLVSRAQDTTSWPSGPIQVDQSPAMASIPLTDPARLPALGEVAKSWELYLRTWRPGKPHRHTWDALYAQALEEVVG
ncbi:hypothetical protein D9M68_677250 [compost metagenome]